MASEFDIAKATAAKGLQWSMDVLEHGLELAGDDPVAQDNAYLMASDLNARVFHLSFRRLLP